MKWGAFELEGNVYDLSHLHNTTLTFTQAASGDKPERIYEVEVEYGLHCFTKGVESYDKIIPSLRYSDSRESRNFDVIRYELSKKLPTIVSELHLKKCFHSGKGNFFLVEMVGVGGNIEQYEIYFAVSKASGGKGKLKLFVQSAYIRTEGNQPKRKPIGFCIILHNIKNGKLIRVVE